MTIKSFCETSFMTLNFEVPEESLRKYKLTPRAKVISSAVVGVEPCIMGIGPVDATKKALNKTGLKLSEINIIKLNVAFAAQDIACMRKLQLAEDDERINPNGRAIVSGHPLDMSVTRIVYSAALELRKQDMQ